MTRRSKLTFADLCAAIDAGRPVLVCVPTPDADTEHWVVIYGYGRRPSLVFVAGQGLPFIGRQRVKWPDFRQQWSPPGTGVPSTPPETGPAFEGLASRHFGRCRHWAGVQPRSLYWCPYF